MTAAEILKDLRDRLADANVTLTAMAAGEVSLSRTAHLDSKAEGVRLALSYVNEAIRQAAQS